jgi:uncharacterized protein YjfI (DUF2170 family)
LYHFTSGVLPRVSNPRNGVYYLLSQKNGPRTQLYRVEMEMERVLSIVSRTKKILSIRISHFGHQTLLAITVGSRQMVAYTYIWAWGISKGPTDVTTTVYPQGKP